MRFCNCLTSRKTIFQSSVVLGRTGHTWTGLRFKSYQGVLHGGVLAYKGSTRVAVGGGGGGRATVDIQFKNDHSFMHIYFDL